MPDAATDDDAYATLRGLLRPTAKAPKPRGAKNGLHGTYRRRTPRPPADRAPLGRRARDRRRAGPVRRLPAIRPVHR